MFVFLRAYGRVHTIMEPCPCGHDLPAVCRAPQNKLWLRHLSHAFMNFAGDRDVALSVAHKACMYVHDECPRSDAVKTTSRPQHRQCAKYAESLHMLTREHVPAVEPGNTETFSEVVSQRWEIHVLHGRHHDTERESQTQRTAEIITRFPSACSARNQCPRRKCDIPRWPRRQTHEHVSTTRQRTFS